jgi:hypothetical protein
MPQVQTADGRGRPEARSVFNAEFRRFVAGADVQKQRHDAYEDEYAEMALKGTQRCICCPAGGELHLPEGGIVPISPWDWVVELPDGTLGSFSAEQVADTFEFVDGPDEQREAYERTVEYVENARKARQRAHAPNPPIRVDPRAEVQPHPDSGEAAEQEFDRRRGANVAAEFERQAQEARRNLQAVIDVARSRDLITGKEADEWLDSGFAPDGVHVTYQQALGTWEVNRPVQTPDPSDPGVEPPVIEGDGEGAGDKPPNEGKHQGKPVDNPDHANQKAETAKR